MKFVVEVGIQNPANQFSRRDSQLLGFLRQLLPLPLCEVDVSSLHARIIHTLGDGDTFPRFRLLVTLFRQPRKPLKTVSSPSIIPVSLLRRAAAAKQTRECG